MKRLFVLFLIAAVACESVESNDGKTAPYFDLNSFVNSLIQTQSISSSVIEKTTLANAVEEKVKVESADSMFWKTELTPLLNADINKPSLFDAYTIESSVPDDKSNLLKNVYEVKPNTNASVQKLEIKYLKKPSEVRQIVAIIHKDNPVYDSYQKINLWTNRYNNKLLIDSLSVTGYNKTVFQDSLIYQTKLSVNH